MNKISSGRLGSRVIELVLVILFVRGTLSECPGNPNRAEANVVVDESSYDRNYSEITSEGKQPLGFRKAVWPFNQPDATPCIVVTGASSRRLEIMFEAVPESRLCVKLTGAQLQCSDPGTGRLFICPRATADTLYVEFTCDSQCAEHDVQFWYRLVLGDIPENDPEDHWCQQRSRVYPGDLRMMPSKGYALNTHTEKPGGVRGNEQADRLAGAAPLGGELIYDKADRVRARWNQVNSAKEQTEYPYLERLIQRGVSRGSGWFSTLRGKDRRTFNQVLTGTISLGTLRWLL